LDIYIKAHLLIGVIDYLVGNKLVKDISDQFVESLKRMENDLNAIIKYGESKKLTMDKYMDYVEVFANVNEHNSSTKEMEEVKELREMLRAFQTLNDKASIKILERLFIQLVGHINVISYLCLERSKGCCCCVVEYVV
jgi:hypothetical protein